MIGRIESPPARYSFRLSLVGDSAPFAVVFAETITGAVALHTFAEMIRKQYGPAVEIIIPEGLHL